MGYLVQRVTAYIALLFIALFYLLAPERVGFRGWQGGFTMEAYVVAIYIILGLIPHRHIVPVTWRFRLMMGLLIAAFAFFFNTLVWPLMVAPPLALNLSRIRHRIRQSFRHARPDAGRKPPEIPR